MSARRMSARRICAVLPVKDTAQAKQRLAGMLSAEQRRALALAMAEDVLQTLAAAAGLAGILVVTADPAAAALAARYGARITGDGARAGHTAAVAAAADELAAEDFDMLALPGDIPLIAPADVARLLAAHPAPPAFTIVPARDQMGSNAVLCSPAAAVPLRFGDDSFFPHLHAARARGIEPVVMRLPRIALDIDTPEDLALFRTAPSRTRARTLLDRWDTDLVAEFGKAT
jgi:2-phospho-L-lactate/phosphoenolpyruvate guanylyltransferase